MIEITCLKRDKDYMMYFSGLDQELCGDGLYEIHGFGETKEKAFFDLRNQYHDWWTEFKETIGTVCELISDNELDLYETNEIHNITMITEDEDG